MLLAESREETNIMRAAFLAYDGCALWQVTLLQMFLQNAGIFMETVTVNGKEAVSDGGLRFHGTADVSEVSGEDYDVCIMAGGNISSELVENEALQRFLYSVKGWLAASCASTALAGASGRVSGPFTCMPHTAEEFAHYLTKGHYTGEDVCVNTESRLITSKGYAHYDFMMAVLTQIGLTQKDPHLTRMAIKLSKNLTSQ
jgi:putative intracellular protease/amidase